MDNTQLLAGQYKTLLHLYDTEVTRFWTRFNIFLGFQIALVVGLLSGAAFLALNVVIFRLVTYGSLVISSGSCIIHWRGYIRQRYMIRAIAEIEKRSNGTLCLLEIFRSFTSQSPSGNSFLAALIGCCMLAFWIVLLLHLECFGYALN